MDIIQVSIDKDINIEENVLRRRITDTTVYSNSESDKDDKPYKRLNEQEIIIKNFFDSIWCIIEFIREKIYTAYYMCPPWTVIVFGKDDNDAEIVVRKRKFLGIARVVVPAVFFVILTFMLFYSLSPTKRLVQHTKFEMNAKDMYVRRWSQAPCRKIKQMEMEFGRTTLVMNETHVLYIEFGEMLAKQERFLLEESSWTDVVCASMLGPSKNVSMPCSCSFFHEDDIISGFDFHMESSSKAKARLTEQVPSMGHPMPTSVVIPKVITLSYFDYTKKAKSTITLEGAWVSTGLRAIAFMNDIQHQIELAGTN